MTKKYDIKTLYEKSYRERVLEYAEKLEDGKGVSTADAAKDMGVGVQSVMRYAEDLEIGIRVYVGSRMRTLVTNPKTAEQWRKANK